MSEPKKKPGVAFWAIVVVVVVLMYPLSFGPACWISSHTNVGASALPVLYHPLTWGMSPESETVINRVITWYAKIGAAEYWEWGPVWDLDWSAEPIGWRWGSTFTDTWLRPGIDPAPYAAGPPPVE